ncbi:MAG TPA: tetratricopeptide repeat protein [Thermoanaerobaculia bacterium]|nr:tetratricopeptide repeat protein [Thermoanaerobaculia bacterium]
MRLCSIACLVLLTSCATAPADDPVRPVAAPAAPPDLRLTEIQVSLAELLDRVEILSDRLQRVESTAGSVAPARTQARLENAPPAPAARSQAATPADPPPATRMVSAQNPALAGAFIADKYRNALTLYGKGRVDDSRRAFMDVFESDTNGELADNALYWIGETYFATGRYSEAMKYYRRIETEYPQQNKAPDAILKIGLAYEKLSDLGLARRAFESLIAKYPYSGPAGTARQELKRIKY